MSAYNAAMTVVISEVFKAFRSAGVPEDRAHDAAAALAAENLATNKDIQELKAVQRLHSWMLGFNLAFTVAILWKVFS